MFFFKSTKYIPNILYLCTRMDNKKATLELGTKPVGRLLYQYALPATIAMVASSLYNIIDRIFIGQYVGADAIAGLAITFPFMNLGAAFGAGVGVGASTAIAVKLGQKDYLTAENILGNTVTLNLIIGIAYSIVGFLFLNPILRFFGASDATLPYAREFMQIILLGNVVTHMYFGMNAVLRAASKPRQAMNATIFTVGMNIILDYLFIVLFHWGIRGAATATVISQSLALCYQMKLFSDKRQLLHLKKGIYRLKSFLVKNIISIGISPFLMNVCSCLVVILVNNQFVRYGGDMAVASFGISNSYATVFVMFMIGLNQGMQPIAGYNYGAQKLDRLLRVYHIAITVGTIIMTVGWIPAMLFPRQIARLFTTDNTLLDMCILAIRCDMLMFPIIGFQMVTTSFFQCIGKVKISIFLSLSRQLIILIPLLIIFPLFWQLNGVWAAIPTSDGSAAVIAFIVATVYMRKFKRQLSNQNNYGTTK